MDGITSLPNEIICHIVSLLSAKEAVFTAVLSKRFLNLYNIIQNLEFSEWDKNEGSFTEFLDGVLALPASSRIRKFSIDCFHENAHVNRCLCAVLKHGVLDLELDMPVERRYSLPFEVFTCKTIVKLMLGYKYGTDFVVDVLPKNASLPALKTLILNKVRFKDLHGCAFQKLLSACHVLTELIINGMEWKRWRWSGNISSPTLQRLTILCGGSYETNLTGITLDTPSLTYFKCNDVVPDAYPVVNLDSLVKVELGLMMTVDHIHDVYVYDNQNITSNPTNLIKGLRNVQIMNFTSPDTFQGQLHYEPSEPESVCSSLSEYSFLLSSPLKVLQITDYTGTTGAAEQLGHFIRKLPFLKLVKLNYQDIWGRNNKKLMIPNASSKCEIKVTSS